jgi:hypothetical protein
MRVKPLVVVGGLMGKTVPRQTPVMVVMVVSILTLGALLVGSAAFAAVINCSSSCVGTSQADTITGNANANKVEAKPGEDYIHGKGGSDTLLGNRDSDEIYGGGGPDELLAGKHMETDYLYGQAGNDTLNGVDEFSPGATDYLDCGDGNDTALVDGYTEARPDVTINCETVIPTTCPEAYPPGACETPVVAKAETGKGALAAAPTWCRTAAAPLSPTRARPSPSVTRLV